jgi:hypothetical protein
MPASLEIKTKPSRLAQPAQLQHEEQRDKQPSGKSLYGAGSGRRLLFRLNRYRLGSSLPLNPQLYQQQQYAGLHQQTLDGPESRIRYTNDAFAQSAQSQRSSFNRAAWQLQDDERVSRYQPSRVWAATGKYAGGSHFGIGAPEKMGDRDPDTGKRFPTALAMREAKLRDWLRVAARLRHSGHIACRDFMVDPR